MIAVHHLGNSQSERIVWLCEELRIGYTLHRYDRDPFTGEAPPAYKALHPMGLAPVIEDSGRAVAESGAVIEYLIARHGGGRLVVRPDADNFSDYLFWFHFANATMMPSEQSVVITSLLNGDQNNTIVALLNERSDRSFQLAERRLAVMPYVAGQEFTAADIMMVFPMTTMRRLALLRGFTQRSLTPFPHIRRYLQRIGNRAAYQEAMRKADPGLAPLLD